jgi:hypothetical protein
MNKRTRISNAVAAAFLAASAQLAFAVDEMEPNDALGSAQQLAVGTDGQVVIQGAIGVTEPGATPDVDYYSFEGSAGDAITLDIDGGMKAMGSTGTHVDTVITVFAPDGQVLVDNHDSPTIDEGSAPIGGERDARIDAPPLALPVDGKYVVAVSSESRFLAGSYTLIISGVTPPQGMQYVNIDIKPGDRDEVTRLNPKQKRDIPIALLSRRAKGSMPAFNPLEAKIDSITFGRGGEEKSLVRCLKQHIDVNRDGMPDLVCLFDVPSGNFEEDDTAGKLKGQTKNGSRFEAVGKLKVKAPEFKHKDRDRPHWHGHGHGHHHGRDNDRHDGKHHGHDRDDDRRGHGGK